MILDELAASGRYAALHTGIARAFAFLRTATVNISDGRHEIDGERVYANVMSYTSKVPPGLTHEAHRRYADVQFILHGEELIRFTGPMHSDVRFSPDGRYLILSPTPTGAGPVVDAADRHRREWSMGHNP